MVSTVSCTVRTVHAVALSARSLFRCVVPERHFCLPSSSMHSSLRALPASAAAPLRTRLSSRSRAAPRSRASVSTMASSFYDLSIKARTHC